MTIIASNDRPKRAEILAIAAELEGGR